MCVKFISEEFGDFDRTRSGSSMSWYATGWERIWVSFHGRGELGNRYNNRN